MLPKTATFIKLIIDSVWALATGWNLPGFHFNFATLFLGVTIIGVMLALLGDFLVQFGVKPFDTRVDDSMERQIDRGNRAYKEQEAAWWSYYDRKYGGD